MKKILIGLLIGLSFVAYSVKADDATQSLLNVWKRVSGVLQPTVSTNGIKVPSLASSNLCLKTDSLGNFATTTCGSAGSGLTSLNGLTADPQTFAVSTSGGISLLINSATDTHTFTAGVASGYTIPLTTSTTEWTTAYNWGNHALVGYLTSSALTPYLSTTTASSTYLSIVNAASTYEPILTKGNLTENVVGLEFNNTRQVIGGAAQLSLSSGYAIPSSTDFSNWNTAYGWGNHAGLYPTFGYGTSVYATILNYPTYTYASSTYYFASNPNSYITSSALTPYLTTTTAASTYQQIGSYLTEEADPVWTSASASYLQSATAATTYASFTYASSTYAFVANLPSTITCSGTDKISAYNSSTHTFTCTTDALGEAGGGITTLNGLTADTQSFAVATSGGLTLLIGSDTSTHTFTLAPYTGYSIPLTASTTNFQTAFLWGNHASAGYLTASDLIPCLTTTSAASTYQPILTLPLAVAQGGTGSTSLNTTIVSEGINLYYTDARARASISASATPITYNSTTGKIGFTNPGYITGNQSITVSGAMSGSGTTSIPLSFASTTPIAYGGTGTTTAPTLGQILIGNANGGWNYIASSSLGSSGGLSSYNVVSANGLISIATSTTLATLTASTSPTFTNLYLNNPLAVTQGGTGLTSGFNNSNWDNAYTDRLKWDGGATGLVAATGRTSLGLDSMAQIPNTGSTTITTLGTIASLTATNASTTNLSVATNTYLSNVANCTNGVITGAGGLVACNASAFLTSASAGALYPTFAYGTSTYATIANYPTYTYASSTFATIASLNSYPTFIYASSAYFTLFNTAAGANILITTSTNPTIAVSVTPSFTSVTATNASTTNITNSGNSYLGTILSGTWNGGAIDISSYTNLAAGRSLTMSGDSVEADAELYTWTKSINLLVNGGVITATTSAAQFSLPSTGTITWIGCNTDVGGATIQLDERGTMTPGSGGTDVMNAALNCLTTGAASTTSFSNAGISDALTSTVNLDIDAASTTPTRLRVIIKGTYDD